MYVYTHVCIYLPTPQSAFGQAPPPWLGEFKKAMLDNGLQGETLV